MKSKIDIMKYGLTKAVIDKICGVFGSFAEVEKAVLYGSRAKGNYKTGSDIDLSLFGESLTHDIYENIAETLDELLLPYKIDLSIFETLENSKLQEHIERVGVVFYERKNQQSRLNKGWEIKKLGDVCELYQPKTISTKEMKADGEYDVFGANGIIGKYDKFNHAEPALLITCRGATCGSVNISNPYSWINGNAMVVKPLDKNLDTNFLEYLFRGGIDLSKTITGAAQPQITRQTLSPTRIPIPPIPEQKQIVAVLDEAFAAIDKAKANVEKNLKNAREIFESQLNSILTKQTAGWDRQMLEKLTTKIGSGATPRGGNSSYKSEGTPLIRSLNIHDRYFKVKDLAFIDDGQAKKT